MLFLLWISIKLSSDGYLSIRKYLSSIRFNSLVVNIWDSFLRIIIILILIDRMDRIDMLHRILNNLIPLSGYTLSTQIRKGYRFPPESK